MKVSSMIMAASAVVLSSSIYARPSLLPRMLDIKVGLSCLFEIVNSRNIPDSCNAILTQFNFVQSAAVSDMTFNLKGSTPQISFRKASVRILGVPGITTLPIVRTKFDLSIWDGAAVTSSFVSDWTSVSTKGFELEMDIEPTTLIVDPENLQALISLLSTLRSTASHTITLRGHASVDLALSVPLAALGVPIHLDLKTIPVLGAAVSTDMNLQGLNNFGGVARGLLDSVSAIEKVGASAGLVRFKIVLHNPASVTIQLGKIKFQVWTSSAKTDLLGIATYEEFNAVPGENIADTVLEADSAAKLGEFFPVKTGFSLTFTGYDGSSDHPIAVGVMSSIEFIVEF